ncbi:PspC domain-containing protein [Paenibacillus wulumuqiensis]|uniref:PspC domain-containing protein n=1 Tax=Paenibacillus wulumuqiensis TaxID=1567107 RepID=UPI000619C505|nr:PspC domain-containing protein [Paenibacillus wulumuqiensis]
MSKLYRSNHDRMMTGLLGGFAELLGMSATFLRLLFVVSVFLTGGTSIIVYFIAALLIPRESQIY